MATSLLKDVVVNLISIKTGIGSKADIVLSANNGADRVILPVVPSQLPAVNSPQNNETFGGIRGDMGVIGTLGLRTLTLDDYLLPPIPTKYGFCRPYGSTAADVINFIKKYQAEYIPFRITITYSNGSVYLNMACLVNDFSYYVDNVGDYHFTLELIEYKMVTPQGGLSS